MSVPHSGSSHSVPLGYSSSSHNLFKNVDVVYCTVNKTTLLPNSIKYLPVDTIKEV